MLDLWVCSRVGTGPTEGMGLQSSILEIGKSFMHVTFKHGVYHEDSNLQTIGSSSLQNPEFIIEEPILEVKVIFITIPPDLIRRIMEVVAKIM